MYSISALSNIDIRSYSLPAVERPRYVALVANTCARICLRQIVRRGDEPLVMAVRLRSTPQLRVVWQLHRSLEVPADRLLCDHPFHLDRGVRRDLYLLVHAPLLRHAVRLALRLFCLDVKLCGCRRLHNIWNPRLHRDRKAEVNARGERPRVAVINRFLARKRGCLRGAKAVVEIFGENPVGGALLGLDIRIGLRSHPSIFRHAQILVIITPEIALSDVHASVPILFVAAR
mmetsp:Transcript_15853/g.22258  ORF Transcript_15853/g.22258 Transcript_15853/m.22258 type:complete len:231 (-) Transcript_15853:300-992(-)